MKGMTLRDRGSQRAVLVATSLLLAVQGQAQEEMPSAPAPPPMVAAPAYPTALETYLERPGILLVRRYHRLAPVQLREGEQLRLDAVAVHEPGMEHQRVMGIRVEIDAPGLSDEERVSYIDLHEIEELVKAIDFIEAAKGGEELARDDDRVEMSISTQDGLELGVVFSAGGKAAFLRTASARFAVQPVALAALRVDLNRAREHLFSN